MIKKEQKLQNSLCLFVSLDFSPSLLPSPSLSPSPQTHNKLLSSRTTMYVGVTKRAANHLTQCLDSHPPTHTTDPHYLTVNHCQRSKSPDSSQAPTPQANLATLGIKLHCSHNRGAAQFNCPSAKFAFCFSLFNLD